MPDKTPPAREKQEIVVFSIRRPSRCDACSRELLPGDWLTVENEKARCLKCAGLDDLEYLPAGDATLTRRAIRHAPQRIVVVRWARARKRYERQGILVTAKALARARAECEADAQKRKSARRQANADSRTRNERTCINLQKALENDSRTS